MPDFPINPIRMDGYLQTLSPSVIRDLMSAAESESKFTQFLPGDFIPVTPAGTSGESSGASGIPSKDVDPDVSGTTAPPSSTPAAPKAAAGTDPTDAFSFVDRYVPGEEAPVSTWTPYSPAQNLAAQRSSMGTAAAVLQAYASAQGTPAAVVPATASPENTAAAAATEIAASELPAAAVPADAVETAALVRQAAAPAAAATAQEASPLTDQAAAGDAPAAVTGTVAGKEVVSQAVVTDRESFAAPLQDMLAPMAELRNVVIREADRGDAVSLLEFDVPHTQQVLSRLLTTSLGFSPNGGPINLIVDTEMLDDAAARLRFVIQAQQMELPAAVTSYLNENSALPVGPPLENLALNLTLCRQLAALMNGNLAVRSDGEGNTLFYLDLPVRQGKANGKAASGEIGRFSGRRILLAMEDSPHFRFLADLLHKREMFPDSADSIQEAVRRFEESRPGFYDAVITSLPPEATRLLRSLPRRDAAGVPVLALLRDPSGADLSDAFDAGCTACLPLDLSAQELFSTLGLLMLS